MLYRAFSWLVEALAKINPEIILREKVKSALAAPRDQKEE